MKLVFDQIWHILKELETFFWYSPFFGGSNSKLNKFDVFNQFCFKKWNMFGFFWRKLKKVPNSDLIESAKNRQTVWSNRTETEPLTQST